MVYPALSRRHRPFFRRRLSLRVPYFPGWINNDEAQLEKDTLDKRPVTRRASPTAKLVALPRVGGLHHRYEWREAA
jgi:hypothetical protein